MSFGFGFALPAYPLRGGTGNNPFNQLGPTLDLSFAGVVTDLTDPNGYTLNTDFIIPQYQIAAQYVVWETGVGLVDKTFSQIITFTRASTGTYFDSAGVLQSAAINAPRFDYNPSTLAAQGLLIEESRTNLITSSAVLPAGVNVTITADTFVAPDGTTTGDQILDNATLGEHYSDSSFTPTAATNYTFSAFIKNIGALSSGFACLRMAGDFSAFVIVDLSTFAVAINGGANFVSSSVQAINNGWYRVSVTGLSVGTTASVARIQVTDVANLNLYSGTGEGFAVWGRQLEAGAFPTSYIPTTTTALTRSADVASVNTLSPWYNASEGTLFAEATSTGYVLNTNFPLLATLDNGTNDNRITISQGSTSNSLWVNLRSSAVGTTLADTNVDLTATPAKIAGGFSGTTISVSVNGQATVSGTTNGVPSGMAALYLGSRTLYLSALNGYLRRITYYPRRLSNAELQAITA